MDYTVVIDRLAEHGQEVGAAAADASSTVSAVRLDAADSAMPGSLSAAASRALQGRFSSAATELGEALERYTDAVHTAADGYRQQEEQASSAIATFFGQG